MEIQNNRPLDIRKDQAFLQKLQEGLLLTLREENFLDDCELCSALERLQKASDGVLRCT